MVTAGSACVTCGTALRPTAKFCDECGSACAFAAPAAEYKQVTVLFADVVRSMDIAAAVGAERLREIMADLVTTAAAVVQRYGGTVDKFTGDGIMAVFGAPVTMEDHAFRGCLAALGIQGEAHRLAREVADRHGIDLRLRVGLNSGQVVAGEIGNAALGYTTIGEQVGMAQRMESAAPAGGVMLSESTARLVENATTLGEPELVSIKGAVAPVPARRLIAATRAHRRRSDLPLIGRVWELNTLNGILDEAIAGAGCVIGVLGAPGIGKSRIVREASALASTRDVSVFTTYCESHTSDIPFHAVTGLLRSALGVEGLDDETARTRVRVRFEQADPEDLLLLDDLLGIADPGSQLPSIEADARRRRLTALVNSASLARREPAIYVIEDAHWIDEVSESMLAAFLSVIPQTPSMVLITYRPEYRGPLSTIPGTQTIALRPLNAAQATALIGAALGTDSSVRGLTEVIAERASGNPFFAEEIVRDLSERKIIRGEPGSYLLQAEVTDISVPATLQTVIAARLDRLSPAAKRTVSAAAVIGSRFRPKLLDALGIDPVFEELLAAELIDRIAFTPDTEYAFRHPLIRAVAYESQLKSDRCDLHRRLANAIEQSGSPDESAVLIAEHFRAAGDLHPAFAWHMRAGSWLTHRDLAAARASWQHARSVADRLPEADPQRVSMRIAPRTLLCATAWLSGGSAAETGFDELRELTSAAGDKVSLAIGMAGWISTLTVHAKFRDAVRWASELVDLLDSIGDPQLTVGLLYAAYTAKLQCNEAAECLRLCQRVIDLAGDNPTMGNLVLGSPLAGAIMLRGCARCSLGDGRWRNDVAQASAMAGAFDVTLRAVLLVFKYSLTLNGPWLPGDEALPETAAVLELAERAGDDFTLSCARYVRGVTLLTHGGPHRDEGMKLLALAREAAVRERFTMALIGFIDIHLVNDKIRMGELDDAIALARPAVAGDYLAEGTTMRAAAVAALVEALLNRGEPNDIHEAQVAVERLEAVPTEPGFVLNAIWLLRMRALLASALDDTAAYHDYRDRYRAMANSLGFEGHVAWAREMA
ncbi:cyclase [Mycobacterium asiaticum]|nr:cyclase [Mycobacterium asiaticum]